MSELRLNCVVGVVAPAGQKNERVGKMASGLVRSGEVVWNQGFEFSVSDVRYYRDEQKATEVLRFTGHCTANPVNDSIRGTGYDGGTYGWRVVSRPWHLYRTACIVAEGHQFCGEFVELVDVCRDLSGGLTGFMVRIPGLPFNRFVSVGDLAEFCL